MTNTASNPFDDAATQLRQLGIKLTAAPGEYIVNFAKGKTDTEYRTDDLDDALAHGLAKGPAPVALPPLGPMGKGSPSKRAQMYAHNRKIAKRRLKAKKTS